MRTMPTTRDEILAAMPEDRRARIKARSAELHAEVEVRNALCNLADLTRAQISQSLGIKQPSVVKIEKQTDLYLSTLRRFVEAAGGTLERRVELPGTGPFTLTGVGEIG